MCSTRLALKGGAPKRLMIDATHLKAHVRDINFELKLLFFAMPLILINSTSTKRHGKPLGGLTLQGYRGLRAKEVALKDP